MSFSVEAKARLVSQGITTTILRSSEAKIPTTGDYIVLTETGGSAPTYIHNAPDTPAFVHPALQVVVGAATADAARALAILARNALCVSNITISGTRYLWIRPLQEPFGFGTDSNQRARFAFNVHAEKRPS